MNSRRIVGTIGIVGTVLAVLLLPFWSRNDEVQAQGQYHVFLPAVLNAASPNQPTVPLPEPSPTPLPEKREFNLSLNLREQEGVTILNDRPDWDGRANNLVSFITVNGTAEFLFQRWGPPGKWDTVEAEKTVSLEGTVNLAEYEQGIWNDTLQKVTIADDSVVVLYEENDGSGITIVLTASLPEPSPTPLPNPEKREFNLSLNLREQAGVTILNDRPDWDGKASSIVSLITVDGTAEFLFQRWGPPGKWDTVEAEKTVTLGEGSYNLVEYEGGIWNDTLQKVTITEGGVVVLSEESDGSGITIILIG